MCMAIFDSDLYLQSGTVYVELSKVDCLCSIQFSKACFLYIVNLSIICHDVDTMHSVFLFINTIPILVPSCCTCTAASITRFN